MSRVRKRSGPRPIISSYRSERISLSQEEIVKAKAITDKNKLKDMAESRVRKTRYKAAINENTPKTTLKRLMLDEDSQVANAAKKNPLMHEKDEERLLKLANSVKRPTRLNVAKNPNASPDILIILLRHDDYEITQIVKRNPNFDDACFDVYVTELKNVTLGKYVRRMDYFIFKKIFKKQWSMKYVDFAIKKLNRPSEALEMLRTNRIEYTENEWLDLFHHIRKNVNMSENEWGEFWYDAFMWKTNKQYSDKELLAILTHFGEIIKEFDKLLDDFFDSDAFKKDLSPELNSKLFELTGEERFLPQNAKDIFLF